MKRTDYEKMAATENLNKLGLAYHDTQCHTLRSKEILADC